VNEKEIKKREKEINKKEKELAKREELLNQQEESFKTKQLGYFFLLALMIIGLVSLIAINLNIVKEINETERVVYKNN
jgi:hypothetical protein